MLKINVLIAFISLVISATSFAATPISSDANVYIISPAHGEVVSSPVTITFGLSGAGVAPAGVDKKNTGHHHLIIDATTPSLNSGIAKDANHKHFGGGQTQTTIKLSPGKHTLQLMLGDKAHVPHDPAIASKVIEITVK